MTYSAVFCISTSELHERFYAPYTPHSLACSLRNAWPL